ncbi:MAG: NAD-binding protein [Pirellulaceae bacterium]
MAQTFAQLGAEVYVVESEHGILPREDRDAAEIVQSSMLRDGVKLLVAARNWSSKTTMEYDCLSSLTEPFTTSR